MKKFITTEYTETELQELIQLSVRKVLQDELSKLLPLANHSPPINNERFISRKKAQEILGISYPTICKLTKLGVLNAIILGGSYRYKESDILNFQKLNKNENINKEVVLNLTLKQLYELNLSSKFCRIMDEKGEQKKSISTVVEMKKEISLKSNRA